MFDLLSEYSGWGFGAGTSSWHTQQRVGSYLLAPCPISSSRSQSLPSPPGWCLAPCSTSSWRWWVCRKASTPTQRPNFCPRHATYLDCALQQSCRTAAAHIPVDIVELILFQTLFQTPFSVTFNETDFFHSSSPGHSKFISLYLMQPDLIEKRWKLLV